MKELQIKISGKQGTGKSAVARGIFELLLKQGYNVHLRDELAQVSKRKSGNENVAIIETEQTV